MSAKKQRRAVGYVRVSKVGGREGDSFLSPEPQREQIEAVARHEGLEVAEVIEELDASGGDSRRPGWNRAIEMVERGEVGGIVVWNFARASRSTRDFLTAWDRIEAAGGRLYSATEQTDDTPAGKMLRTILVAVAENERDRARASFMASAASAVERGVYHAGTVPLGYRRGPEPAARARPEHRPGRARRLRAAGEGDVVGRALPVAGRAGAPDDRERRPRHDPQSGLPRAGPLRRRC